MISPDEIIFTFFPIDSETPPALDDSSTLVDFSSFPVKLVPLRKVCTFGDGLVDLHKNPSLFVISG